MATGLFAKIAGSSEGMKFEFTVDTGVFCQRCWLCETFFIIMLCKSGRVALLDCLPRSLQMFCCMT